MLHARAVAALAHGGVGEADRVEMILIGLDAGAVDLDLDDVGVDAVDGGAESFIEHGFVSANVPMPKHTKA